MEVTMMVVGPVRTNCYIVSKEGKNTCVVIDPGEEGEKIAGYMEQKGLSCEGILLTHGHFDHISGVKELAARTGAKVCVCEKEQELIQDPAQNGSILAGYEIAVTPDVLLRDRQVLEMAGLTFRVIYTPGHTVGGCCFYSEDEGILFAGDTIFQESVGRTDLPTGNGRQLIDSIREKIFVLPDEVRIYPGHGPESTVGYEKKYNPYA